HLTGNLVLGAGNLTGDYSKLVIGGTFGGSSIESGDSLKLVFDTDGAGITSAAVRTALFLQGYDSSTRNVEIAGAGAGTYGKIDFGGGRRGGVIQNADLHDLSKVYIAEAYEGGGSTNEISGSYFHDFSAGAYAITAGKIGLISHNVIQDVDCGILGISTELSYNTITRSTRGGIGVDAPSYPGSNQTVTGNTISGFDSAVNEIWRLYGVNFNGNAFDDSDYGIKWTNSGGGNAVSFNSVGDVFGGTTPNGTYDLYLANLNNGDAAFNLDASRLESDADPLNELCFMFNDGLKTYIAWRDFDGVVGDYRVWSSTTGLNWSDMVYAPRLTGVLTLEKDSAYSIATPTKLTLTSDAEIGDLFLNSGTTLVLNGFTLKVNVLEHALDGSVDNSLGGSIVWLPEPATLALLAVGAVSLLRRRRR
ncbi:MAG TPA: PEP-CTERM sorting domain-containing protein, partial [Phycisphaerae bacterium]|nr:PEP-CTERM sorting domain-containing protein [Phycisphaerae bacterium]